MKIERRSVGTVEVYAPLDSLADDNAEEFGKVLRGALRGPNPRVVVAMSEVGFMDSKALNQFADVSDELSTRSALLKLAGITPTCREIFELTGLSGRFQFFEDVDAAVRSFR